MADKNSTSIIHGPRKAELRRANPPLEYEIPTDDIELPSVPPPTLPRQLTFWRRGDPSAENDARRTRCTCATEIPSLNDHGVTQQIKRAFAIFDIQVLDHLLVGKSVVSFAEFGLL